MDLFNPEDIVFSHHCFMGTIKRENTDGKDLMIGVVSPIDGTPHAYVFKCTGDALEFLKDMMGIVRAIDKADAQALLDRIEKEEAENNAGRD